MATIPDALASGWTYHQAGDLRRAEQIYREVLRNHADSAQAWCLLGVLLQGQGKLSDSVAHYQRALQIEPEFAEARNNLGLAHYQQGDEDEAAASFRAAIRLKPQLADAHNNLGIILQAQGKLDEAAECYRKAIELDRAHADAHHNLGNTLRAQGRLEEASDSYERALWIKPNEPHFHLGQAFLSLQRGDYERGWPGFEWRWKCPEFSLPDYRQPFWDGGPLDGRTILLHADYGMGDTLQFIRFAPRVANLGGRVIVVGQRPLARILASCPGVDQVFVQGDPLPDFDFYAPVMSLPSRLNNAPPAAAAAVPYLAADPRLVEHWKGRLGGVREFKIGVAWQGDPRYRKDRERSFPLAQLEPIAQVPGVRLFSLQRAPGSEQIATVANRFEVTDLGSRLTDFLDDAAVMSNLDLVLAPETSLIHLAGALGTPAWVALAYAPDWRWMSGEDPTQWYPTVRLFRQRTWGDWDQVFQRIANELRVRVGRATA